MSDATGTDAGFTLESTPLDSQLDYHPKVKAMIERELKVEKLRLTTCTADDLKAIQCAVRLLSAVLRFPESIRAEEKRRLDAGQPASKPEDFDV